MASRQMGDATRKEVEEAFRRYDTGKTGVISLREAHAVLESSLGYSKGASKRLVRMCDKDRDGKLSYDEFIDFYFRVKEKTVEMRALFAEFDPDHTGSIDVAEAKIAMRNLGLEGDEVEYMIRSYDVDGDGRLQYAEFLRMWNAS